MSLWPIAELLPHSGQMILLDEVIRFGAEDVETCLTVRPSGLFNLAGGSLPAWVGVELMAQTVAAFAGCQARQAGEPVKLGFLLGTRSFKCNVEHFPVGTQLQVSALCSLSDDNGMGVFECHISGPNIQAEARLNVFCPPQIDTYLTEPET